MRTFLVIAAVLLAASLALGGEVIRSRAVHRAFLKATGYPQGRPGFVADHIFPLCAGGRDAVDNLQWQSVAEGKVKDRDEKQLCLRIRQLVAAFDAKWRPTP